MDSSKPIRALSRGVSRKAHPRRSLGISEPCQKRRRGLGSVRATLI